MTGSAGTLSWPAGPAPDYQQPTLLGVPVANLTQAETVAMLQGWVRSYRGTGRSRSVFIVNAHTLNLAWESAVYRDVLRRAELVLGDGTGVRLAARLRGARMRDNLVGTDLIPRLMGDPPSAGLRYFLLGATTDTVTRAAAAVRHSFSGLTIAGCHHGYLDDEASRRVVERINAARPDVLLVAMGNPLQECWIDRHLERLRVPVSIGVGGLFDHWAGNLVRAPRWVRLAGFEWLQILLQQPEKKWRRYLLGNPRFVARALIGMKRDRAVPDVTEETGCAGR